VIKPTSQPTHTVSSVDKPMYLRKRDGSQVSFDPQKIISALTRAFASTYPAESLDLGVEATPLQSRITAVASVVLGQLHEAYQRGETSLGIEYVQDKVELALLQLGEREVALAYIAYREKHEQDRQLLEQIKQKLATITIRGESGDLVPLDPASLINKLNAACVGLDAGDRHGAVRVVLQSAAGDLYAGMGLTEVDQALIMAARTQIEREPRFTFVAAQLLLGSIQREVTNSG